MTEKQNNFFFLKIKVKIYFWPQFIKNKQSSFTQENVYFSKYDFSFQTCRCIESLQNHFFFYIIPKIFTFIFWSERMIYQPENTRKLYFLNKFIFILQFLPKHFQFALIQIHFTFWDKNWRISKSDFWTLFQVLPKIFWSFINLENQKIFHSLVIRRIGWPSHDAWQYCFRVHSRSLDPSLILLGENTIY